MELPRGEGIGYELLELAARAEAAGIDPETALRAAARVYRDAIRSAEGVGADTDEDAGEDGEGPDA